MQLKRVPLDLDVVFLAQLVDPSLADVAERSNVVREDINLHGHWSISRITNALNWMG
jgi:hypothetical protein